MEYDPKILSHSVWNSITSRCRWKVTLAELLLVDLSRHETWGSYLPQDPVGFFHRRFGIQLTAENGSQAVFFDPSSRMWFFQWSAQRMQQWIPKMLLKAHNKQHTHTHTIFLELSIRNHQPSPSKLVKTLQVLWPAAAQGSFWSRSGPRPGDDRGAAATYWLVNRDPSNGLL